MTVSRGESDAFGRCHPAVGLVFFAGAVGLGAVVMHPAYILASVALSLTYYILLNGAKGFHIIRIYLPLTLLMTFLNPLLNTRGERVLFHIFGRPYTLEALLYGAALSGMLIAMMLWMGCYNAVMTSDKVMTVLGNLVPTVATLFLMVLRLVPNLFRKHRQLAGARRCIGHGTTDGGSKRQLVEDNLNIFSALISWALEGGAVTADSMKSRGYGTGRRTTFTRYSMTGRDGVLLGLMAALIAAVAANLFAGGAGAEFTPVMEIAPLTGWRLAGWCAYVLFLSLPTVFYIKEAIQWRILRSGI